MAGKKNWIITVDIFRLNDDKSGPERGEWPSLAWTSEWLRYVIFMFTQKKENNNKDTWLPQSVCVLQVDFVNLCCYCYKHHDSEFN